MLHRSIISKMGRPLKRLWLHDIGVFEIIPNSGKGSCLFQAISQALTFSSKFHYKVRTATVSHMISRKWDKRLRELPEFWKHKIIRLWLRKERAHFMQREQTILQEQLLKYTKSRTRNKVGTFEEYINQPFVSAKGCWCYRWLDEFIERQRHRKYFKIKKLIDKNNNNTYSYMDSFKYIFHKFMSQRNEPGTKFELEAAANLFHFHFDYLQLQLIPPAKNRQGNSKIISNEEETPLLTTIKFTPSDFLNRNENGTNKIRELRSCEDMDDEEENGISAKPNDKVLLNGAMYQFYSCRNNCNLPRGLSPEPYDHYFFMHSPKTSLETCGEMWDRYGLSTSSGLTTNDCGHWELLLPISIKKHPVPLNRKIFGFTYEITDAARNFTTTRCGQRREILDNIAKAIDCYVQENPNVIPPEDPNWPPDDTDDYIGCAASLMRDSYYQSKFSDGITSSKAYQKSLPNHDDECCWWHSTTRNINHRDDVLSNTVTQENLNTATSPQQSAQDKKKSLHYHFYRDNLTGLTLVIHDKSTVFNRIRYWRYKHFRSINSSMIFIRKKLRKFGKKKKPVHSDDDLSSSE